MFLLADALNLPLLMVGGLVTFGPLTLFVTTVESAVFRWLLATRFRAVFGRLFLANVVSTLAGGILLVFQGGIVYDSGITESIPAFVRGYRWLALVLMATYFLKSVVVEGLVVQTKGFRQKIERTRGQVWRTVAAANVATYLFVAPVFYFTTRPHFGGLETTFDTHWTANADAVVCFIDPDDHFIKSVRLDGTGARTLVPHPASGFLMSADARAFVYQGQRPDSALYGYRVGETVPRLICKSEISSKMSELGLSADHREVLFCKTGRWDDDGHADVAVCRFDLDTGETTVVTTFRRESMAHVAAWSADGQLIYVQTDTNVVSVFSAAPPHTQHDNLKDDLPPAELLAENYATAEGRWSDQRHGLLVASYPHLMGGLRFERNGQRFLVVKNEYGLLDLGLPTPQTPTFLPRGSELPVDWGERLYVLDYERRRIGLLTRGGCYALRTPRFRVSFEQPDCRWW